MEKILSFLRKNEFDELKTYLFSLSGREKKAHLNLIFSYKYHIAKNPTSNLDQIALIHQYHRENEFSLSEETFEGINVDLLSNLEKIYFFELKAFFLYYYKRSIPQSIETLEVAKQIAINLKVDYFSAKISNLMGIYQLSKKNKKVVEINLGEALDYYSQFSSPNMLLQKAKILLNLGSLSFICDDYGSSINRTKSAANLLLMLGEYNNFVSSSINLSLCFQKMNDNHKAIEYLENAKKVIKKIEQPQKDLLKIKIFERLATLGSETNDKELTFYYGRKLINIALNNVHKGIGYRFVSLANRSMKDIDRSISLLEKGPNNEIIDSKIVKAELLLDSRKFLESQRLFNELLIIAIENEYTKKSFDILRKLIILNRDYISAEYALDLINKYKNVINYDLDSELMLEIAYSYLYSNNIRQCKEMLEKCGNLYPAEKYEIKAIISILDNDYDESNHYISECLSELDNQLRTIDTFRPYLIQSVINLKSLNFNNISRIFDKMTQRTKLVNYQGSELSLVKAMLCFNKPGILIKHQISEITQYVINNDSTILNRYLALLMRNEIEKFESQIIRVLKYDESLSYEVQNRINENEDELFKIYENYPVLKILKSHFGNLSKLVSVPAN